MDHELVKHSLPPASLADHSHDEKVLLVVRRIPLYPRFTINFMTFMDAVIVILVLKSLML